jgi:hypothetical protein
MTDAQIFSNLRGKYYALRLTPYALRLTPYAYLIEANSVFTVVFSI